MESLFDLRNVRMPEISCSPEEGVIAHRGAAEVSGVFHLCIRTDFWLFLLGKQCICRDPLGHLGIWVWSSLSYPPHQWFMLAWSQLLTGSTLPFISYSQILTLGGFFSKGFLRNRVHSWLGSVGFVSSRNSTHFQNIITTVSFKIILILFMFWFDFFLNIYLF